MLKIKAFFVIFLGLYTTAVVAVDNNIGWKTQEDVSMHTAAWGGGTFTNMCDIWDKGLKETICIGDGIKNCGTASPDCDNNTLKDFIQARDYTDEAAELIVAAVDVDANCARFCPIQVEAKNKKRQDAWPEYVMLSDQCVYMCRDGFVGASHEGKCYPAPFTKESYNNIKRVASGGAYNESMPLFASDGLQQCGVNHRQRHDVILGIVGWLPSGHGAFVQQLVVHAARDCWPGLVSWPSIYPKDGAQRVLVCKVGYQPNSGDTDCVAIDEEACASAASCDGWTSGYDPEKHYYHEKGDCYEYRCKEAGFAFVSDTDRTCTQCVKNARQGIDMNGLCVECPVGKIIKDEKMETFDSKNGNIEDVCVNTSKLTKTDLQYGSGKTKSTAGDLDEQCWTKGDAATYKTCVTGT
ncbi:MAG: hypothetical protein R8N24_03220 [Alphaproteobacteria bacterium]|nr:hypothetical protein [Alphaproteobacteria bacterium]